MAQQDGLEAPPNLPEHRTTTQDKGRFCMARCTCGWYGPARRARSQARTDAENHRAG
ncbi:hypothetical protein ABZ192_31305 [Streptomyces sp. NPDC006235]|uniref:hypothetical protein n=1 Tax=Streptomyces sp. NPDC006235 TaxID=3156736 RepID=UPI0033B7EE79